MGPPHDGNLDIKTRHVSIRKNPKEVMGGFLDLSKRTGGVPKVYPVATKFNKNWEKIIITLTVGYSL